MNFKDKNVSNYNSSIVNLKNWFEKKLLTLSYNNYKIKKER